jgi:hypothetical protein
VGAVTLALYDLFDYADDDDYMILGTLWGHNDDHNSAEPWSGISAIWDVLRNFDPQPEELDHDHCWNIYEFVHGWHQRGYPIDADFVDLMEAHAVPVFLPGNVNGDADQRVTIGDVSMLIDHLFITQSPLEHPSSADVDASCGVSIGDVSRMIDALFVSLDQSILLAGCVDLYP